MSKSQPSHGLRTPAVPVSGSPALNRRTVFAGAGAVGALAAVATVLPGSPAPTPVAAAQARPDQGGGYQLTEHVKQYYATARV